MVCRIKHWQCLSFEYSYTQILKATSSCLQESGAEKDKPQHMVLSSDCGQTRAALPFPLLLRI